MSLSDFLTPVNISPPGDGYYTSQLGSRISRYSEDGEGAGESFDIAIIGVAEERGSLGNAGTSLAADHFREHFYSLNEGNYTSRIVDLGNIKAGHSLYDTYVALRAVVSGLIKRDIVPVIIGGGQDLTYAQYLAYEDAEQKVDFLAVDAAFDLADDSESQQHTSSQSYLSRIFLHQPNYLFNFSNIGYQTYFVSQESLRMMDSLYFDVHRLGDFSGRLQAAEPIIRNANMISFDMTAIRASDAPGNAHAGPNGFYGEEACQIARYAGISDKLNSIGFYEYNPAYDNNGQTGMLLAQMVWCFVDGYYARKKEFPMLPKSHYITYRASLKDGSHELIFVKSKRTDRWWMQVPYPATGSGNERHHLVPCRYEDYQLANSGEMPDLWWRTYQKLI